MTVDLVIPLLKIPYAHRTYVVLANPIYGFGQPYNDLFLPLYIQVFMYMYVQVYSYFRYKCKNTSTMQSTRTQANVYLLLIQV
jgi:hypothetical protein